MIALDEPTVAEDVEFEPEMVPEGTPDMEIVTDEVVPLDAPVLPKTAGIPLPLLAGLGSFSVFAGLRLRNRKKTK